MLTVFKTIQIKYLEKEFENRNLLFYNLRVFNNETFTEEGTFIEVSEKGPDIEVSKEGPDIEVSEEGIVKL